MYNNDRSHLISYKDYQLCLLFFEKITLRQNNNHVQDECSKQTYISGKKLRKTLVILLNDKVASIVMATVSIIFLMSLIIPTIFEGYILFVINYREIYFLMIFSLYFR